MKLIDLYKEWMRKKVLPKSGLCYSLPKEYYPSLLLISPFEDEDRSVRCEFWGCPELPYGHKDRDNLFSETRQTIVLLICAMHDEL